MQSSTNPYRPHILPLLPMVLATMLAASAQSPSQPGQATPPTPPVETSAPITNSFNGETARVLVGFEQSAAPGAQATQRVFADFYFSRPLPAPNLSLWSDLGLASLPRIIRSTVLTLPADVASSVATIPLNELVQSAEFMVGIEYRVAGGGPTLGQNSVNSKPNIGNPGAGSVSLIAGYGAGTPLSASTPLSSNPGQTRFFRQYSGGVRFASAPAAPHVLDVTIGQNAAITGGTLHGAVIGFDSFYALPVPKIGFAYLHGSVRLATSGNRSPGSDLFRLGVGFDFLQMLKAVK